MVDTPEEKPEFDADTRLRMWTVTMAMQAKGPNQSFEGAIRNAAALFDYLKNGNAPADGEAPKIIRGKTSDLKVI